MNLRSSIYCSGRWGKSERRVITSFAINVVGLALPAKRAIILRRPRDSQEFKTSFRETVDYIYPRRRRSPRKTARSDNIEDCWFSAIGLGIRGVRKRLLSFNLLLAVNLPLYCLGIDVKYICERDNSSTIF